MNSRPDVSVIIPAYKAQESLGTALASIGKPSGIDVEIVLSVDDGGDYSAFAAADPRVLIVDEGHVKTGPGSARNRAVKAANAPFLAYLDADDTWTEGYLEALLPIARIEGCAFARTRVKGATGETLLEVPNPAERLMLSDFATWGASFHPVHAAGLPRGTEQGPFHNKPAQDVMHAAEVFMACGLTAPLVDGVFYELHLGESTVTTASDFSERLERAYADYDAQLVGTWAEGLFAGKSALNQRYMAEALPGEPFYAFIARTQAS